MSTDGNRGETRGPATERQLKPHARPTTHTDHAHPLRDGAGLGLVAEQARVAAARLLPLVSEWAQGPVGWGVVAAGVVGVGVKD